MDHGQEIRDLLDIQGTMDWVTKGELFEEQRRRGAGISARQLTNYVTQELIPPSVRIGSRAGAYPAIVVELVYMVTRSRRAGLALDAIREIIPLWKFLARARRNHQVDLAEFEFFARQHISNIEAAYAVPWLVQFALPSPLVEPREIARLEFKYKDGTTRRHTHDNPIDMEFVIAEQDPETSEVRRRSSLRMTLPVVDDRKSRSVILGIPNGVELPLCRVEAKAAPDPRLGAPAPRSGSARTGRPARTPNSRVVASVRASLTDITQPTAGSPPASPRTDPAPPG